MPTTPEASMLPENNQTSPGEKPDADLETEFSFAHKEVLGLMGWFYLINGKFNLAVDLLTVLHRIDSSNISAIKMLCYAWLKSGNYTKALFYCDLLQELSSTAEERITANLLKSRALWGGGRRDEANELMRQVIADRKEMRDVVI